MIIQNNVSLSQKTTMKIGGIAENLYIPETEQELIEIAQEIYDRVGKVQILSGGSNLLIDDSRSFSAVVSMRMACKELREIKKGTYYIGSSNRIQEVLSFVNAKNHGGFEQLVSLPALFGGIIYMNAGIGGAKDALFTISDFVETVRVYNLEEKAIQEIPCENCNFGHRCSIFQNDRYVILGARIKCKEILESEAKEIKKKRMQYCREHFEYGKGCFGTCFSEANGRILKAVAWLYRKNPAAAGNVSFGKRNSNWLVNNGNGTFSDAMKLIHRCEIAHRLLKKRIKCEIIIWK